MSKEGSRRAVGRRASSRFAVAAAWAVVVTGLSPCAGLGVADGIGTARVGDQARERAAVLLEPVPIVPLPPPDAFPAAPSGHPAVGWTDPRLAFTLVVLAVGTLWLRSTARRSAPPPPDVCSVLGEMPLGGTHVARVVRFGPKTILVGVSGGTCRTLAEIDDPVLTDRLVAACRSSEARSPRAVSLPAGLRRRLSAVPLLAEAIR